MQNFDDAFDVVLTHDGTNHSGVSISGGPASYTVSVTGISGDGDFTLAASTASDVEDLAGNALASSATSSAVLVDNTPPGISLSGPVPPITNSGPVMFTIAYTDADLITLTSGDIALDASGTANATIGVTGSGNSERTVTLSEITGDGALHISVISVGTAVDLAGNSAGVAGPSNSLSVDNTEPTFDGFSVSAASARAGESVEISFETSATLVADPDVTVNGNGAHRLAKGLNTYTYTYTVQPADPLGPANIVIVASDLAGNVGSFTDNSTLEIVAMGNPVPIAAWPVVTSLAVCALLLRRRK